eukprot:c21519_g1_i2.p1 GENE.c21519_g1_i2~~c21519_g1_i2.p1  ORF type:complete len:1284 (+),score=554.97 c21519_g1_i2:33-3884(+)
MGKNDQTKPFRWLLLMFACLLSQSHTDEFFSLSPGRGINPDDNSFIFDESILSFSPIMLHSRGKGARIGRVGEPHGVPILFYPPQVIFADSEIKQVEVSHKSEVEETNPLISHNNIDERIIENTIVSTVENGEKLETSSQVSEILQTIISENEKNEKDVKNSDEIKNILSIISSLMNSNSNDEYDEFSYYSNNQLGMTSEKKIWTPFIDWERLKRMKIPVEVEKQKQIQLYESTVTREIADYFPDVIIQPDKVDTNMRIVYSDDSTLHSHLNLATIPFYGPFSGDALLSLYIKNGNYSLLQGMDPREMLSHVSKGTDPDKWFDSLREPLLCSEHSYESPVLTAPGGDLSEFALSIHVYEEILLRRIDEDGRQREKSDWLNDGANELTVRDVYRILVEYLATNLKRKFHICINARFLSGLCSRTRYCVMTGNDILNPPADLVTELLAQIGHVDTLPSNQLFSMFNYPEDFYTQPNLITNVVQATFALLWNIPLDTSVDTNSIIIARQKLEISVSPKQNIQNSVLEVHVSQKCPTSLTYGVSTTVKGSGSSYIYHPQAINANRLQLIAYLSKRFSDTKGIEIKGNAKMRDFNMDLPQVSVSKSPVFLELESTKSSQIIPKIHQQNKKISKLEEEEDEEEEEIFKTNKNKKEIDFEEDEGDQGDDDIGIENNNNNSESTLSTATSSSVTDTENSLKNTEKSKLNNQIFSDNSDNSVPGKIYHDQTTYLSDNLNVDNYSNNNDDSFGGNNGNNNNQWLLNDSNELDTDMLPISQKVELKDELQLMKLTKTFSYRFRELGNNLLKKTIGNYFSSMPIYSIVFTPRNILDTCSFYPPFSQPFLREGPWTERNSEWMKNDTLSLESLNENKIDDNFNILFHPIQFRSRNYVEYALSHLEPGLPISKVETFFDYPKPKPQYLSPFQNHMIMMTNQNNQGGVPTTTASSQGAAPPTSSQSQSEVKTQQVPPPPPPRPEDMLKTPDIKIQWKNLGLSPVSTVDGRIKEPMISVLGADVGQLIIVLSLIESVTKRIFEQEEVDELLVRYLSDTSRAAFSMYSDTKSLDKFCQLTQSCPAFHPQFEDTPVEERLVKVLESLFAPPSDMLMRMRELCASPEMVGDQFLRFLVKGGVANLVRPELTKIVIRSFFGILWNFLPLSNSPLTQKQHDALSDKLDWVVMVGNDGEEEALIEVNSDMRCARNIEPVISAIQSGTKVLIHHKEAARNIREQFLQFYLSYHPNLQPTFGALRVILDSVSNKIEYAYFEEKIRQKPSFLALVSSSSCTRTSPHKY